MEHIIKNAKLFTALMQRETDGSEAAFALSLRAAELQCKKLAGLSAEDKLAIADMMAKPKEPTALDDQVASDQTAIYAAVQIGLGAV